MPIPEYRAEVRLEKDGRPAPPARKADDILTRFARTHAIAAASAIAIATEGWPGRGDVSEAHREAIRAHTALLELRVGGQDTRRFVALLAAGSELCGMWDGEL